MRRLVNSHCSSRARGLSNPSLIGAGMQAAVALARIESCRCSSRSNAPRRCISVRSRWNAERPAPLSTVISSTSGMRLINFASSLPITQVKRVRGQVLCSVRSSGTTWQVSPMADNRSRQTFSGASMEVSE